MSKLFSNYVLGSTKLSNRIVMAPMTRSRAIDSIPNELMMEYYAQRASAGLIITEGTAPTPNALGFPRIPGLFNKSHVEGWSKITKAVHDKGGKIFIQLMHTGRIAHPLNLPKGSTVVAPSAIAANLKIYTDQAGESQLPVPAELTVQEIKDVTSDFVKSAELAIQAGFDGIELHGANGYLIEQFFSANANKRTDEYGQNRQKFVLELASAVADKIKPEKVGIRLSPYSTFNDIEGVYEGVDNFYGSLAKQLNELNLVYIHVCRVGPSASNAVKLIRNSFKGTVIHAGGYTLEEANADISANNCDLIGFGRHFISNPNLPFKLQQGLELAPPDYNAFYTPGAQGYTDYV